MSDSRWATPEDETSHGLLYAVACACVVITLGILWSRPDSAGDMRFSEAQVPSTETAEARIDPPHTKDHPVGDLLLEPEMSEPVTRAARPVLDPPPVVLSVSEAPVSRQLRRPIRLVGTDPRAYDLRALAADALAGFDHQVSENDALRDLLVTTLSEGQSNAYIDAALNAARVRGEFQTPKALLTVSGKIDTPALLATLLVVSQGLDTVLPPVSGDHILSADDSLAGLALRYYGQPLKYATIAEANVPLARGLSVALSGERITIPAL